VLALGGHLIRKFHSLALGLLLLPTFGSAQVLTYIVDAPFVAFRTATASKASGESTTAGTVARRSDGSTYVELGSTPGNVIILIMDVARQRAIELYPLQHRFTISFLPQLKAQTRPPGYVQQYLGSVGKAGSKRSLDGGGEITTVGRREIDGVEAVGFLEKRADGRTSERWYAPTLDVNLELKQYQPVEGIESTIQIQRVQLGEPDPKLFEIPEGYVQDKTNAERVGPVNH
jgi:hypothetical protein